MSHAHLLRHVLRKLACRQNNDEADVYGDIDGHEVTGDARMAHLEEKPCTATSHRSTGPFLKLKRFL